MAISPTASRGFGRALRALDIRREERILICLLDSIDWPTAFLGAIKAGVVPVPVNTLLTEDDYRFMLEDSRARLLVVSEELYPKFAEAIGACADLAHVVVSGANAHGHQRFEELLAGGGPADGDGADGPRRHMLLALHLGLDRQAEGRGAYACRPALTDELYAKPFLGISENDVCYSVAKLFFAYGLGNALTFPMSAGATTVLLPDRPTPDGVAAILQEAPGHGVLCACRRSTPPFSPARRRRSAAK